MEPLGTLPNKLTTRPFIYRIDTIERFYQILDEKRLVFVWPEIWPDPLENLIISALRKGGKPFTHPKHKNIYAQCWSYEGDSYALWQIYTMKADENTKEIKRHIGVRMGTRIDRLIQISKNNKGLFRFGAVNYLYKRDLAQIAKDKNLIQKFNDPEINDEHLRTLLVKRRSYSYEKEIRLLCMPDSSHIDPNEEHLCKLEIEPVDFFTSIRFDPTLDYKEFAQHKEELVKKYGFSKKAITRSTISKERPFTINLDKM